MSEIPTRCFSISVLVVNLTDADPEVLLLKRQDTLMGEWCPVSGSIENGETAWQAGLRELSEETGLVPVEYYSADLCEAFYDVKREQISLEPVFVAFVTDKNVVLDDEHSDFMWVTLEKASDLVPFPKHRRILKHIGLEFCERRPPRNLSLPTKLEV